MKRHQFGRWLAHAGIPIVVALLGLLPVAQAQRKTTRQSDFTSRDSVSVPLDGLRYYLTPTGKLRFLNAAGERLPGWFVLDGTAGGSGGNSNVTWSTLPGRPAEFPSNFSIIQGNLSADRLTGLAMVAKTGNYAHLANAPTSLTAFSNSETNFQSGTQVGTAVTNATGPISTSLTALRSSYDAFVTATNQAIANRILGTDPRLTDARTPTSHSHAANDILTGIINRDRLGTGGTGGGLKVLFDDGTFKNLPTGASPTTNAADLTTGTLDDNRLSGSVTRNTATQTLTGKTLSGASNTFSQIPIPAILALADSLGKKVNLTDPRLTDARTPTAHSHAAGDISTGTLDDNRLSTNVTRNTATQTLTGKTLSGASNTFSNIPIPAILLLSDSLAKKVNVTDPRLTNARTPTGGAGGILSGTYPNPGINEASLRTILDGSETKITAGSNVTVTGSGTTAVPYVISAGGSSTATATNTQIENWAKAQANYNATRTQLLGHDSTGIFRWFDAVVSAAASGTTAAPAVPTYGARYQVNAPEWDTTGLNYKVVNITANTQAAWETARNANVGVANVFFNFPGSGGFTGQIIIGGSNQLVNNWVINAPLVGGVPSLTVTAPANTMATAIIYSAQVRGLCFRGIKWVNNNTTAQVEGNSANNNQYGVVAIYPDCSVQATTRNGKYVAGLRHKDCELTCPSLDYDGYFGNSTESNGVGNLHRDIIFEDLKLGPCGSAGIEYISHNWDNADTTNTRLTNITVRRVRYANLGLVSRKSPKFAPAVSISGRNEISLIQDVDGLNPVFSGVENVGGIDATIEGCSSTLTAANSNATGVSMTNGNKNYDLMRYVTIRNNEHYCSGTGVTGRAVELFRVTRALVQNNVGVTPTASNFRVYSSLIGSLDGAAGTANNWRVTGDGSAVRFQPGSKDTYFQYNTASNLGSSSVSEVIGVIGSAATPTTGNFVRNNTLTRGSAGVTVKQYSADNGAVITGNTITPNTPDTQP